MRDALAASHTLEHPLGVRGKRQGGQASQAAHHSQEVPDGRCVCKNRTCSIIHETHLSPSPGNMNPPRLALALLISACPGRAGP